MAGHVNVDTALMRTTATQSKNIADNMVTQAATLKAGLDYVSQKWQGLAGDAFRGSVGNQSETLDKLIQRLVFVSELINRGGQGLSSQDASAHSNLTNQSQNLLNAPLNLHS